jgi:hypothetical protein
VLGQIKLKRRDGDEIIAQGGHVGIRLIGGQREDGRVPEVIPAAGIFAALISVIPWPGALADDFDAGGSSLGRSEGC